MGEFQSPRPRRLKIILLRSGWRLCAHVTFKIVMRRAMVKKVLRKTGLPAVGEVPWGSHFCVFYETKRDLLDILVPYFKAGLEANEICVSYVGSHEFHSIEETKRALAKRLPEFDELFRKGNIELIDRDEWFGSNGNINVPRTVARFRRKLDYARARGFSGLRFHGSSAWLRVHLHAGGFVRYEQELDSILANQPTIVACTFPLKLTGAEQILDLDRPPASQGSIGPSRCFAFTSGPSSAPSIASPSTI